MQLNQQQANKLKSTRPDENLGMN